MCSVAMNIRLTEWARCDLLRLQPLDGGGPQCQAHAGTLPPSPAPPRNLHAPQKLASPHVVPSGEPTVRSGCHEDSVYAVPACGARIPATAQGGGAAPYMAHLLPSLPSSLPHTPLSPHIAPFSHTPLSPAQPLQSPSSLPPWPPPSQVTIGARGRTGIDYVLVLVAENGEDARWGLPCGRVVACALWPRAARLSGGYASAS